MLRKVFMTEADLEEVARLDAIHLRAAERERRLSQGICPSQGENTRLCSSSYPAETGDVEAYPHCLPSH